MASDRQVKRALGVLLLVPLVGSMVCCGSLKKYHPYPAQYAWQEMREDKETQSRLGELAGDVLGVSVDLGAALKNAEARASEQASSERIPNKAFDEMVAEVSTDLLGALQTEAEANKPYLLYLGLGRIRTGATGNYTQEQLDAITGRIADRLLQNAKFRESFSVQQTASSDVQSVLDEVGQNPDWSVDPLTGIGSDKVPLQDLFVLTGTFNTYPEQDGRKVASTMNVQVQRADSNEVVYSRELKKQYYFHPSLLRHLSKPENIAKLNALDEDKRGEALAVIPSEDR